MRPLSFLVFSLIVLFPSGAVASPQQAGSGNGERGSKFVLLSRAKQSHGNNREITEASKRESVKDAKEDGYLPSRQAIDCFDALGYRYTGGRYDEELIRFRLRCPPKIVPGKKYPLIVWFHGKGESGDDNERQLAHLQYTLPFLTGPKSLDFFMLVTQCPKDNPYWETSVSSDGKGDAPVTIAMEIFEHLIEECPIDRTRISTFGQCSGAVGSWAFIRKYPDLAAAMASICANPPQGFMLKDLAFSAFNCTRDPDVPIEPMRKYVTHVNDAGGNAFLTEVESGSHDAWTPALSKYKVIAWMISQKKGAAFCPPPGVVLDGRTWHQSFWCFGLPICCMILLLITQRKKAK